MSDGELAILPTDTVYGICADVRRDEAVRRISAAKERSEAQPLQLLFGPEGAALERYARLTAAARRLVDALGPGGWTIVTEAADGWESPALAGGRTVGLRIPQATVVQEIVARLGAPLAASSANVHGGASPVTCADAVRQVGEHCSIALDGGPCAAGIDSTVIDCSSDDVRILREGAIDRQVVARILGLNEIHVVRSVRL
jgi:L-threonylcarbamoyladenylate synthase